MANHAHTTRRTALKVVPLFGAAVASPSLADQKRNGVTGNASIDAKIKHHLDCVAELIKAADPLIDRAGHVIFHNKGDDFEAMHIHITAHRSFCRFSGDGFYEVGGNAKRLVYATRDPLSLPSGGVGSIKSTPLVRGQQPCWQNESDFNRELRRRVSDEEIKTLLPIA